MIRVESDEQISESPVDMVGTGTTSTVTLILEDVSASQLLLCILSGNAFVADWLWLQAFYIGGDNRCEA